MQGVKHHLIDILKPNQSMNLADFQVQAIKLINSITKRGKLPFLVGGTGLYISAVIENYILPPTEIDQNFRKQLNKKSLKQLQNILKGLKGEIKIDWQNRYRLIRAIEMAKAKVERPILKGDQLFDYLLISPQYTRLGLYKKIDQRIDLMLKQGLLKEVKKLASKYSWDYPAMSGIGYRQFKDYLAGTKTLEQSINQLKSDTRHYAKRQQTWFKRYAKEISYVKNEAQASVIIKKWLTK